MTDIVTRLRDQQTKHMTPIMGQAADEIEELRRQLSGGCDADNGGLHTVMSDGKYRFCAKCGETLVGIKTRYCHAKPTPI
jgi:hypothetical protein